jgi:hypothetical protein
MLVGTCRPPESGAPDERPGGPAGGRPAARAPSAPDDVRLRAEYLRAVELVRQRQDKPLAVAALAELGDVCAALGRWAEAGAAWSDALDTLLGPYQVLGCWRAQLAGLRGDEPLRRYGANGLLRAVALLGKISRWAGDSPPALVATLDP